MQQIKDFLKFRLDHIVTILYLIIEAFLLTFLILKEPPLRTILIIIAVCLTMAYGFFLLICNNSKR